MTALTPVFRIDGVRHELGGVRAFALSTIEHVESEAHVMRLSGRCAPLMLPATQFRPTRSAQR